MRETKAIVLDYLPNGHPLRGSRIPIVQIIGKNSLLLLEAVPKRGAKIQIGEEVYIGPERREKIHHVVGRIKFSDLTSTAKMELPEFLKKWVKENEERFVKFFNEAGPITTRMHTLELIPGIGKKHMNSILEEREKSKFKSFDDIKERVPLLPDPENSIVKRIMMEFEGEDKYRLFVR